MLLLLLVRTSDRRLDVGEERSSNVVIVDLLGDLFSERVHLDTLRGNCDAIQVEPFSI
jgi:hypothetical protein